MSVCNFSVTSVCLILLILLNVFVQRYTSAFLTFAMVLIYRSVSYYSAESRALANPAPNPIVIVNRTVQQKLGEQVGQSSPMVPSSQKKLFIQTLEAVVNTPTETSRNSETCFVLTHPWGILGGDMDNNVPSEVGDALNTFGFNTVRFNFRGVGKSGGCCDWRGNGERHDLQTIIKWILSKQGLPHVKHIILVGYSYGSMISNSCADMFPEVKAFVSIATPFPCYWGLSLFNCAAFLKWSRDTSKPKLFLCGDEDDFTGKRKYARYTRSFGPNKNVYLVEGVDHSWYGAEHVVVALVLKFLKDKI